MIARPTWADWRTARRLTSEWRTANGWPYVGDYRAMDVLDGLTPDEELRIYEATESAYDMLAERDGQS